MALVPGDPLPAFRAASLANANFSFDSVAGRYVLLAVLSGADQAAIRQAADRITACRAAFDDLHASVFGLLPDTADWRGDAVDSLPGVRWLFDDRGAGSALGAGDAPLWVLCDPALRVLAVADAEGAPGLMARVQTLPPPDLHAGGAEPFPAPVLVVPRLFEPGLCQALIAHYQAVGGEESGFMREIDGKTRLVADARHKRRSDVIVADEALRDATRARLSRFLAPQIAKAFQFQATRVERYLVACYDAESGGHFAPHRDNTTKGTAHRRFAVSINLNADFDGGDLRFPEFGAKTFRPPIGGAVVFSCSLLHEATPVTRGRRYAFLPFLYDEAGAKVREDNLRFLDLPPAAGGP
jgi:predicted 2-oxoglutarate/Fe(II)-dependent dioxygenase YbiX